MIPLKNRRTLVVGLGVRGRAACRLLCRCGAKVVAVDLQDTPQLRREAVALEKAGTTVHLGMKRPYGELLNETDLGVISVGCTHETQWVGALRSRNVPVIGEFELGCQQALCLNITVTGTNGKTTTAGLIDRVLTGAQRRTCLSGSVDAPVCDAVEATKELDYLVLDATSFQLELTQFFRPSVAVLMNISPDHMDHYGGMSEYVRAKSRLFLNQQSFDWAIVQSEALAQIRSLGIKIPSKVLTFSAENQRAEIFLKRGLIMSQVPGWEGPLLDTSKCRIQGPQNAEALMAALAVGRVLRISLDQTVEVLQAQPPLPHRCELVDEVDGVQFINDSRATNLDGLRKTLAAMRSGPGGEPNVWLVAGGRDKGAEFYDVGPLLSRRVKTAFLLGETRNKLRSAWSLFTPCRVADSMDEAFQQAAENAVCGDIILLSPACEDSDSLDGYQSRGEKFRLSVKRWTGSLQAERTGKGSPASNPSLPQRKDSVSCF